MRDRDLPGPRGAPADASVRDAGPIGSAGRRTSPARAGSRDGTAGLVLWLRPGGRPQIGHAWHLRDLRPRRPPGLLHDPGHRPVLPVGLRLDLQEHVLGEVQRLLALVVGLGHAPLYPKPGAEGSPSGRATRPGAPAGRPGEAPPGGSSGLPGPETA